ncbi:MAG: DNA topology modulation protein [Acidobacteriota bacterium]
MKRVVIIGSGGAGKSTFARRLGEITGLEVIHLDRYFWRPNWEPTPEAAWKATVARLLERESWIMDGNFGGTRRMRLRACDTVIFLDLPRHLCFYRVLKRGVVNRRRVRPDMAEGCNERFDPEFLKWVWNYPNSSKIRLIDELKEFSDKQVITLRSQREVREFLAGLENGN